MLRSRVTATSFIMAVPTTSKSLAVRATPVTIGGRARTCPTAPTTSAETTQEPKAQTFRVGGLKRGKARGRLRHGQRPDLDDGDGSFDDWKAREEAINKFKGENDGVIYPVRVKQEGLFNISDEIPRPDYTEMAQEEMGILRQEVGGSDRGGEGESLGAC